FLDDVYNRKHTNPILKAVVRSPRADPPVSRRSPHGQARWQTTRPCPGEILAADDPAAAAERAARPRLLPARGAEGLDLPLVAAGAGPPRPGALHGSPG